MSDLTPFSTPEAIPFQEVLDALLDDDHVLDPRYLYRLSDMGPQEVKRLKEIWPSISEQRRRSLLEDLEELTEANTLLSFELLFRFAIHDQDPQVRFYAIRAIEVFDTDDLIQTFLQVLEEDESVDVRAVTASVLGKYVYRGEIDEIPKDEQRQIEETLLAVLNSDEPSRVRRRALEAVSYSPRAEVHEHIAAAYQRENEAWLASALFAMGRSYDHRYDEKVCSKILHPSPKVRAEAVRASGELILEEAVPDILDLLDDVSQVRRAAIWALSQIGGEGVAEAIQASKREALSEEEEALIERALDNLAFTEGRVNYQMFDVPIDVDEDIDFDNQDWAE
ncbi:MAG: HEAT repeat domain-containing protein [Anaerolineales bacterium]